MPAQSVKVCPPALLQAASSAAVTAEQAAAPHPGVVPVVTPGSPADAAWAGVGAGIAARSGELSAKVAGKGPAVQATTQSGVAQLQEQDEQNAAQIRAVGESSARGLAAAGAPGGASAGSVRPVNFNGFKESVGGWDDPAEPWTISPGMEQDEFGHFQPPVVPVIPGGAPGGGGGGAAPI
jgi:hypothetical protein